MDSRSFNSSSNSSSSNNNNGLPAYSGFLFLISSSFFYGSNFLPIKHYETGDGMFFQLILCIAIWSVGFVINCFRNFPKFQALPLLGGFLWATGNASTVWIIRTIGLGLGMLLCGSISLVIGWSTARFGWFGIKPQIPSRQVLNYIGVFMALLSALFYLFVKTETKKSDIHPSNNNTNDFGIELGVNNNQETNSKNNEKSADFIERLNPMNKRIVGITLSFLSGIMFAQSNTPILYASEHSKESSNYLDYIFSFYSGILLTSFGYFMIYCIIKKNKPDIYPQIVIPGIVSGWMWGVANLCYFLATNALNQAITYPISNSGPQIVASLWGIFLYKEIRGLRNFSILLVGFSIALTGSILTGFSK